MSYFLYTDLISSLLDPRLADPGSTLIYIGADEPSSCNILVMQVLPNEVPEIEFDLMTNSLSCAEANRRSNNQVRDLIAVGDVMFLGTKNFPRGCGCIPSPYGTE